MHYQIRLFFTALMFYTRIPCPAWVDHSEEFLNRSTRYFPLIGWVVGGASAGIFAGMLWLWSPIVAILGSLFVTVWLTGAFHEDGLADVCDGFGGGWTKEKILEIMKDSRLGTFGALGLFLAVALKVVALYDLTNLFKMPQMLLIIVTGHSLSRWISATVIFSEEYARDDASSKIKPIAKKMLAYELLIASFWGIVPLVGLCFMMPIFWLPLLALPAVWITRWYLVGLFNQKLAGYTGDCLGATQQITEIIFYLTLCACKNLL